MGPEKEPSPLTCFPSPHLFSSLESSTSEVNVDSAQLPDPSRLPSQTLWPRCSLYFVPHPPPVPLCLGQLPPCYPVAQPTQGGDTPACPQWTSSLCSLPLHPTLASGLNHSLEQFPTSPKLMDSMDSSCVEISSHCWKLMPGTLLLGSSWEHSSALHPPHMETPGPLSVEAGH